MSSMESAQDYYRDYYDEFRALFEAMLARGTARRILMTGEDHENVEYLSSDALINDEFELTESELAVVAAKAHIDAQGGI